MGHRYRAESTSSSAKLLSANHHTRRFSRALGVAFLIVVGFGHGIAWGAEVAEPSAFLTTHAGTQFGDSVQRCWPYRMQIGDWVTVCRDATPDTRAEKFISAYRHEMVRFHLVWRGRRDPPDALTLAVFDFRTQRRLSSLRLGSGADAYWRVSNGRGKYELELNASWRRDPRTRASKNVTYLFGLRVNGEAPASKVLPKTGVDVPGWRFDLVLTLGIVGSWFLLWRLLRRGPFPTA